VREIGGGIRKVTITGGEPLEQDGDEFIDLLRQLLAMNYLVSIETSGMYPFIHYAAVPYLSLVVDLKSPTTVPGHQQPLLSEMAKLGSKQHCIKVVISSPSEFEWALTETKKLVDAGCYAKIFFSPDHTNMKAVDLFNLMMGDELCRDMNIGLNLQLHKYLFPDDFREEELISTSILKEIHNENQ
jgi:organic radical activating enzyme